MEEKFLNLKINILNKKEALSICENYFKSKKFNGIFFLNAHCCNIAMNDIQYADVINRCSLVLNDGIGVKLGLSLFGIKEKENMNGTDFIPDVLDLAVKLNKNIYLLGGKIGVVDSVEEKLKHKNPSINIVGSHHGYFNKEESDEIINEINMKKVDLLIVGMGVPNQEKWISENSDKFTSVKIGIAGGAILDFLSENVSRAPVYIRNLKLEWLYRLYLEPKRLWRRYLIGNFKFIYYVIKEKICSFN